jgi:hypothetical protein
MQYIKITAANERYTVHAEDERHSVSGLREKQNGNLASHDAYRDCNPHSMHLAAGGRHCRSSRLSTTIMFDLMASAEPAAKPMLPTMLPIIEDRQGDCRHAIANAAQMTADAARERLQAIGDCDHNTDCRIVAQADYSAKLIQYEAETGNVCRITNDALDAQLEKSEN